MEKVIINMTNTFIDIIISSASNFGKIYENGYNNIKLLTHYYVKTSHNKNINIVKYCFVGAESLKDKEIFYFCGFSEFNMNNKENGYIIPLDDWNKICRKYNIVFIPQIEKIEDGFLFISDIFYIKNKEKEVRISAEDLINKYNKDFKEYFTNYANHQKMLNL